MRALRRIVATGVLLALLTGCRLPPAEIVESPFPEAQKEVERTLREILAAAEKKDLDRLEAFHLFGPKFTKFSERGGRQDGDVTRQSERRGIGALAAFRPKVEDLKVDVFGSVAIATFIMNYEVVTAEETSNGSARSTLVFVNDDSAWKIVHEHFSPLERSPQ